MRRWVTIHVTKEELPVNGALAGGSARATICYPDTVQHKETYLSIGATPLHDAAGAIIGAVAVPRTSPRRWSSTVSRISSSA